MSGSESRLVHSKHQSIPEANRRSLVSSGLLLGICLALVSCSPEAAKPTAPTDVQAKVDPQATVDPQAKAVAQVRTTAEADAAAIAKANAVKEMRDERFRRNNQVRLIWVGNADGSDMKHFTNFPDYDHQSSPAWSPDGKLVAFDAYRKSKGEILPASKIVLVNADGSNPHSIADGGMPKFSPDGSRILYTRFGPRGIWVLRHDRPEVEPTQIDEKAFGADWSLDGRIVFANNDKAARKGNLVVANIDHGHRDLLFDEEQTPYVHFYPGMAWSPDSTNIVFKADNKEELTEIGIVDSRGDKHGIIRRFVEPQFRPRFGPFLSSFAWSRDAGSRFLISIVCRDCKERDLARQIFVVDANTGDAPQRLPGLDQELDYYEMAYSPDGQKLLFSADAWVPKVPTDK